MLAAQARLAPLLARDGLRGVPVSSLHRHGPERDRRWPESTTTRTTRTTSAARSFPALATTRPHVLGLVVLTGAPRAYPLPVILYR